jgi:outer membrane protein TolC
MLRLEIDKAAVRIAESKNQALPRLDVVASAALQGAGWSASQANDKLLRGDYASYSVGAVLEQPIGNRAATADLRQKQFEHTRSIVAMQGAVNDLAVRIGEQVRKIAATYEKIHAYRGSLAAAEAQLQALAEAEEVFGQLTPEFLRTKLDAQRDLADAEDDLVTAIFDHNTARAELSRITGTVLQRYGVELSLSAAAARGEQQREHQRDATVRERTAPPPPRGVSGNETRP